MANNNRSNGKTIAQKEYNKELNRIKRFIKNAEKRGYRFEDDIIPDTPQTITKSSVKRLKKLNPTALYEKATALSSSGKVISGTEKLKEEHKERAKRSAQTRKAMAKTSYSGSSFESQRRRQDEEEKRRLEKDEYYKEIFNQGRLIYQDIQERIATIGVTEHHASELLGRTLQEDIDKYGQENVFRNIANAPAEFVEDCEYIMKYDTIYYGAGGQTNVLVMVKQLITGSIMTAEEAREMQEAIDKDDYI